MISIIVPAYNEEETIAEFLNAVKNSGVRDYELVLVNDGSIDKTAQIIKDARKKYKRLRLINHEKNLGLGAALRTGIKNARGNIIVTLDCDMTHPPALISRLVSEIKERNVDVCIASRYVHDGGMKNVSFYRVLTSRIGNILFSLIFRIHAKDVTSGFKAYKASMLRKIKIIQNDFSVQLEIMAKLAKQKAKFCEIPFILVNRKKGRSKFNAKMYLAYLTSLKKLF